MGFLLYIETECFSAFVSKASGHDVFIKAGRFSVMLSLATGHFVILRD